MAERRGRVPAIAIAGCFTRFVSTVIVGARRADQLADNLAASDIELTGEELATLDALGAPELEYPAWALASQDTRHGFRVSPRRQRK